LLRNNWDLLDLINDLGNVSFKITVHTADTEIEENIQRIFKKFSWEPVTEYGIERWKNKNNLKFHVKRPTKFLKTYRNDYKNMAPWHSNPDKAFDICIQQNCPLLYEGAIYKCSTSALLKSVVERHNWPNADEWQPYIPEGLLPTCSQNELEQFIDNFGKSHLICGQCPSGDMPDAILMHNTTVKYK
jgi:hypothetical protein